MRIRGRRRLVSILKFLVDAAFFVVLTLGLVGAVVSVSTGVFAPEAVLLELPVQFELEPDAYRIEPLTPEGGTATIRETRGTVELRELGPRRILEGFALVAILVVVVVFVLYQLRGIFGTLKAGEPFVAANVFRIRTLGVAILLGELSRAAAVYASSWDMRQSFTTSGLTFRPAFEPSPLTLFLGLVVLVLAEVFRLGARMKRDIEIAREIQFDLVPGATFEQKGVRVRSLMRPADTVGGDYYDVIRLDDDKVAVIQADVAGKGIPAALLMAVLQGSLRTLASAGFRGARLIESLNGYLHDNTPPNRMVTLFYGELDTRSGRLAFVNAGHARPFILRSSGTLERLETTSVPLGILPDLSFVESRADLGPGERLLLYTDGLTEAVDAQQREYGERRLREFLATRDVTDDDRFVHDLVNDVVRFCKPADPADDLTLVLVSRG